MFCGFVTKHACDRRMETDGRTDRQNYDPQDRASIAASRGKNKISDFIKRIRQFGYINCIMAIDDLTDSSDYELFVICSRHIVQVICVRVVTCLLY